MGNNTGCCNIKDERSYSEFPLNQGIYRFAKTHYEDSIINISLNAEFSNKDQKIEDEIKDLIKI